MVAGPRMMEKMAKGPPSRRILPKTNALNPLLSRLAGQKIPETRKKSDMKYIWSTACRALEKTPKESVPAAAPIGDLGS